MARTPSDSAPSDDAQPAGDAGSAAEQPGGDAGAVAAEPGGDAGLADEQAGADARRAGDVDLDGAAQPGGARPSGTRRVPDEAELERMAVDVRIRRRPRYGVFIVLGMLAAAVAAFVWATRVPQEDHVNWGATVWVATLGALGFGALLGAGVAVFADWLSRRK